MTDLHCTHAEAMMFHARRRMRERFGLTLTEDEYHRMCEVIRDSQPKPVAFTVGGNRVFKVRKDGQTAYAIWKQNRIATFYPTLDWIQCKGGRVLWRNDVQQVSA